MTDYILRVTNGVPVVVGPVPTTTPGTTPGTTAGTTTPPLTTTTPATTTTPPLTTTGYLPFYLDGNTAPRVVGSTLYYCDASGIQRAKTLSVPPAGGGPGWRWQSNQFGDRWVVIHADGAVFDGYDTGQVVVAQGVKDWTISRCWFHGILGQDNYGIRPSGGGTPFGKGTVSDCLMHGQDFTHPMGVAIWMIDSCGPLTVLRTHIYNVECSIGFNGGQTSGRVQDCYLHDMSDGGTGGHFQQINVTGSTSTGTKILHNHITGPNGQTSSIMVCHDHGNVGNVEIDANLFDGKPQNTMYAGDTGGAGGVLIGNVRITNNRVAKANGQNPGGFVIAPGGPDPRVYRAGNVIHETGLPVLGG